MIKIGLFGAGGHSKVVYESIKSKLKCEIDIYDDKKIYKTWEKKIKLQGTIKDLIKKNLYNEILVSIGNNKIRYKIFQKIKKISKSRIFHNNPIISPTARVGKGTIIMANSVIQSDIVGENCIINTSVSIDHDCKINSHTHICPGVNIAGGVSIGKSCWIGIGAKIIENVKIGNNVLVGAGSVVTKNIKSNSFVMGVPAKNAK